MDRAEWLITTNLRQVGIKEICNDTTKDGRLGVSCNND